MATAPKKNEMARQRAEAKRVGLSLEEVMAQPVEEDAPPAKAGGETKVEFRGDTYVIPAPMDWDIDVMDAFEKEHIVGAVRALLGPEQWTKFRAKNKTVSDLMAFSAAMNEAGDGELGE